MNTQQHNPGVPNTDIDAAKPVEVDTEPDQKTIIAVMGLIANWLDDVEAMLTGMVPTDDGYMEYISQKNNLEQLLNAYFGGAEGADKYVLQETIRHAKAAIQACKFQPIRWLENNGVQRAMDALKDSRKVCDEALPSNR
jgi:hypothetical protein